MADRDYIRPPGRATLSKVERRLLDLDLTRALGYSDYLELYQALKEKVMSDPINKETIARNKLLLDTINSARSARKEQVDTELAKKLQAMLEAIKAKVMSKLSKDDQEALQVELREEMKTLRLLK